MTRKRVAKACPGCGVACTVDVGWVCGASESHSMDHDFEGRVCSGCGLPVALWAQWRAARELAETCERMGCFFSIEVKRLARKVLGRKR